MKLLQVFEKAEGGFQTPQVKQGAKPLPSPTLSIWDVWKSSSYLKMTPPQQFCFVFVHVCVCVCVSICFKLSAIQTHQMVQKVTGAGSVPKNSTQFGFPGKEAWNKF